MVLLVEMHDSNVSTSYFHLIRMCSISLKFHFGNGDIWKLKAWSSRLWKNFFLRLNIEGATALYIM